MARFLLKAAIFLLVIVLSDAAVDLVLKRGLYAYLQIDQPAKVLCIGHSHTMSGIDEELLARNLGVPVAKYALCGVNPFDRLAMLQQYFSEHQEGPTLILYDVDHLLFNATPRGSTAYRQLYPFMANPEMARYLESQATERSEYAARYLLRTIRYLDATRNNAIRGYLGRKVKAAPAAANVAAIRRDLLQDGQKYRIRIHRPAIDALEETLVLAQRHKARVELIFIPTMDLANDLEREKYQEVLAVFRELSRRHGNVGFIDYNPQYQARHALFFDSTHLNRRGQLLFTQQLSRDVARLMQ